MGEGKAGDGGAARRRARAHEAAEVDRLEIGPAEGDRGHHRRQRTSSAAGGSSVRGSPRAASGSPMVFGAINHKANVAADLAESRQAADAIAAYLNAYRVGDQLGAGRDRLGESGAGTTPLGTGPAPARRGPCAWGATPPPRPATAFFFCRPRIRSGVLHPRSRPDAQAPQRPGVRGKPAATLQVSRERHVGHGFRGNVDPRITVSHVLQVLGGLANTVGPPAAFPSCSSALTHPQRTRSVGYPVSASAARAGDHASPAAPGAPAIPPAAAPGARRARPPSVTAAARCWSGPCARCPARPW